jgi:hypothetical protein
MKPVGSDWLTRLGGSQPFFSVADERQSRRALPMGPLAAGALPEAVRSSHGYQAQLPTDLPVDVRMARSGDFFRI